MHDIVMLFRKAMIDKSVRNAVELAAMSGISEQKVRRFLQGDATLKIIDVATIAASLGLKIICVPDEN